MVTWTNIGVTETVRTGLSLLPRQPYYFSVKARNVGGLWSKPGTSNAIIVGGNTVYLPLVTRGYSVGW
ncbi:MAG: hypothetical protein Q7O66_21735 [Dehalococcoidia bacterium]|nr:hypothetical protein [Dehalococcoidia bacterium]